MRAGTLALVTLVACGPAAKDLDGFTADEDCDDDSPFIYPGAPDVAGDGIDADCDGTDPEHTWLGTWDVDTLYTDAAGDIPEDVTWSGELLLDPRMIGVLDLKIYYPGLPILLELEGPIEPSPHDDSFFVYVEGTIVGGESADAVLDCAEVDDYGLQCKGTFHLLAPEFDLNFNYPLTMQLIR